MTRVLADPIRATVARLPTSGLLALFAISIASAAEPTPGQTIYTMYCAACHGPEGAGLVGPNLTDTVFIHGGTKADIVKVITKGVGDKGMPTWEPILTPKQIDQVADHLVSLIGKNLKSPFAPGVSSVTPFPTGTPTFPLLMRTFMPTLSIDPAVFAHHSHGQVIAKYSPEKGGDVKGEQKPVDGVPSAIAVTYGESLSYCFDTVECRLLYTWSGPFMDMTAYWGPGSGGGRKSFDYVPEVIGPVWWRTSGAQPMQVVGASAAAAHFTGYRKAQNVPELQWRIGDVQIALRITPGAKPGEAVCRYTTSGAAQGLVFTLPADSAGRISADKGTRNGATLTLSAADAAQFTLTITPGDKPVVEAPKPRTKDDKKTGKPATEAKE